MREYRALDQQEEGYARAHHDRQPKEIDPLSYFLFTLKPHAAPLFQDSPYGQGTDYQKSRNSN